jgi:hypothetical protein
MARFALDVMEVRWHITYQWWVTCMHVVTYICMYMRVCVCIYTHYFHAGVLHAMYACMYACMHVCMSGWFIMYVCMNVWIHLCKYECAHEHKCKSWQWRNICVKLVLQRRLVYMYSTVIGGHAYCDVHYRHTVMCEICAHVQLTAQLCTHINVYITVACDVTVACV